MNATQEGDLSARTNRYPLTEHGSESQDKRKLPPIKIASSTPRGTRRYTRAQRYLCR